jgi:hypothetical protein
MLIETVSHQGLPALATPRRYATYKYLHDFMRARLLPGKEQACDTTATFLAKPRLSLSNSPHLYL